MSRRYRRAGEIAGQAAFAALLVLGVIGSLLIVGLRVGGDLRYGMSIDKLKAGAEQHLYAAEVLQEAALAITAEMEHLTDEALEGAVRARGKVMDLLTSELAVSQGLCLVAEEEQAKC